MVDASGDSARGQAPARRGLGAFVWFVGLLLLVELLASWRVPYTKLPRASEAPRNVRSHRGFPEYISGPERSARPFAVVIGNSQAVGIELADPQTIWFAELRRRLSVGPAPIDVENWSHGGLRTAELELLTLRALERRPDLIVFVLHFRNFDELAHAHLSAASSDVPLLGGRPTLWPRLPGTLVSRDLDLDDRLTKALLLGTSIGRMRNPILDRLSHSIPERQHRYVFGHRRDPGDVFSTNREHSSEGLPTPERRARWRAMGGLEHALEELQRVSDREVQQRLEAVAVVAASIERLVAESGSRCLWVWGPADLKIVPADIGNKAWAFYAGATKLIEASGGTVISLLDAVPRREFVSLSHFGVEGHQRMAELIEPVIRDALP